MSTVFAATPAEWREWLASNGHSAQEVWLVIYNKNSDTPSIRYHESIEHALCYGWIDSHTRKHSADSIRLRFTPRRPQSSWSEVNRERAGKMASLGLMTPAGQAMIDLAKARGRWHAADTIPAELSALLEQNPVARANFDRFPASSRRLILEWIGGAKKAETRRRRVERTVALAAENRRANHPGVR
jgi:uncharacterized protein YdeI (YjbR/CyaY-like superfamily)